MKKTISLFHILSVQKLAKERTGHQEHTRANNQSIKSNVLHGTVHFSHELPHADKTDSFQVVHLFQGRSGLPPGTTTLNNTYHYPFRNIIEY